MKLLDPENPRRPITLSNTPPSHLGPDSLDSLHLFKFEGPVLPKPCGAGQRGYPVALHKDFAQSIRHSLLLPRRTRSERIKDWLCSHPKVCKSWRLGRAYGASRRRCLQIIFHSTMLFEKTTFGSKYNLAVGILCIGQSFSAAARHALFFAFILLALGATNLYCWKRTRRPVSRANSGKTTAGGNRSRSANGAKGGQAKRAIGNHPLPVTLPNVGGEP